MSYGDYSSSNPQDSYYSTSYPSYDPRDPHTYNDVNYTYPQPNPYPRYRTEQSRSRASSVARSETSQPPIATAVNNAFDKSDAASQVDPAVIAQITEEVRKQVIDSLKVSGIAGNTGRPPSTQQTYPVKSPIDSSSSSYPPRTVYTPPSPTRHDFASRTSNSSPDLPSKDTNLDGTYEMSTPRGPSEKPARPSSPKNVSTSSSRSGREPAPPPVRPTFPREPTAAEMTTLEKIWQPLFDSDGRPTARLGQFLRGLSIHIIEDYEPKRSIIISPQKMLKFYEDVQMPEEIFPWNAIFKLTNGVISKLYRDLRCEHHLVQDSLDNVPHIPGLTPAGFETWMTAMILAYPDTEHKRLAKAVLDMPISNADDCKERFPKELPRRLFPKQGSLPAQQRCVATLAADGRIPMPRVTSFPPPPPMQSERNSHLERERSPYAGTPAPGPSIDSSAIADEEDEGPPISIPIERERKPYTAKEGTGKVYEEDNQGHSNPPKGRSTPPKADYGRTEFESNRPSRAQSIATGGPGPVPYPSRGDRPSFSEHHPTTSNSRHQYRDRKGSVANSRRPRSPSFSSAGAGYGTRSEGNIGDIPSSYYNSNIHASNPNVYDAQEEDKRRFAKEAEAKRDWARRQQEEAGYTTSGAGRGSYDDEYYRGRDRSNGYGYGGYGGAPKY